MPWTDVVSAISDGAVAVAAGATAIAAILGLKSWRRELKGRAEFDTARGLIRATYKLRDELRYCRSPFVSGNEFPADYQGLKHTAEEEAKAWIHVYKNRWKPVAEALQEFDTHSLEAEAMWGPEIKTKCEALRKCVHSLYVAIEEFISDKQTGGENFNADRDFGKDVRSEVSATGSDDKNPYTKKIVEAVNGIDEYVRPHLKRS